MRSTIGQTVKKKPSGTDFENYLNSMETPAHEHPSNGGRVPWSASLRYGSWLRRHDKIQFDVLYHDYLREKGY